MGLQSVLRALYPPQCIGCGTPVTTEEGLCGACWRDTPFIVGLVCDMCGTPLPGDDDGRPVQCDDCLTVARPWARGRSVLRYDGRARQLVMRLKHGDRLELARPAGRWMARVAQPLHRADTLVVPVPLHWTRLLRRRYNQAALLAQVMAREFDCAFCPDLLTRVRRTPVQGGQGREDRFSNMRDTIAPHPRRGTRAQGRSVLLIDDVMTSGATLAAASEACYLAGADEVSVLTLARVARGW